MILTRKVIFSAGHRYWHPELSEAENHALFGPWSSPFNHGHNFTLLASVTGEIDPATGMVVNIKRIDDVLKAVILKPFDQKSLNDEVPHFATTPPSTENLLLYIRDVLRPALPKESTLVHLELHELPTLWAALDLRTNAMTLTRSYEFAASHRLHSPELSPERNLELYGKCNNPAGHGHNYVLEVTVQGEPDPRTGFICDLGVLDEAVEREVVARYDHKNLDVDIPEFHGKITTSEVVTLAIFQRLKDAVPAHLAKVKLWETARNAFEVTSERPKDHRSSPTKT